MCIEVEDIPLLLRDVARFAEAVEKLKDVVLGEGEGERMLLLPLVIYLLILLCIIISPRTAASHHLCISRFRYSMQRYYMKLQGVDGFGRCQTVTDVVIEQLNCLGKDRRIQAVYIHTSVYA